MRKLSKRQRELYTFLQDNHDKVCLYDSADAALPISLVQRGLASCQRINERTLIRANELRLVAGNVYVATHATYTKKQTIVWWNDEIVAMLPGKKKPRDVTRAEDIQEAIDKRGVLKP